MKIRNLTGHTIRIYSYRDDKVFDVAEENIKCVVSFYSLYRVDEETGVRLEYRVNQPIINNLPDQEENTIFVVSSTVASAVLKNQELYGDRFDLYVPKGKVLKEEGSKLRVQHCKALSQVL